MVLIHYVLHKCACVMHDIYELIITGQNQTIMGSKKNLFIGKKKCSLHLLIM